MRELFLLSGTELAQKVKAGELSSRDLVQAHIDRINAVNPKLNAMIATRFNQALEEADQADRAVAEGRTDLPMFHGVPCSIKEAFALTGMPNTSGLVSRRDLRCTEDATGVKRLRNAGAIPLGVTNVSELCMWMESANRVYGRTRNPYDQSRIVGGSSGGEGAIIGAGAAPFGLGSDIGGSIRMPAFFNGIFGHKPTGTLVPNTGQFPISVNEAARYLTTGPMCRKARDLWPMLQILAGPDGVDPQTREWQLGDPQELDLSRLRVVNIPDNGLLNVSGDLRAAQAAVAAGLEKEGAILSEMRIPELKDSFFIWGASLQLAGGPSFKELMGGGTEISGPRELAKWFVGRSPHTFPAIGLALIESLQGLAPGRSRKYYRIGQDLKARITELLGDDGIILYPSYPSPAPRHNQPMMPPFNWVYTAIINILELPSTQVPLGLNQHGLPLGVQVIAGPGMDHLTIGTAIKLEEMFGGWVPPKGL